MFFYLYTLSDQRRIDIDMVEQESATSYTSTDFVDNMPTETDKVVSSTDDYQLICRSGPRKTKLENLAVNQSSVANIAILHKLVQDGMLPLSQVFDYMSYTTYLYRLMNAYDLVSVYVFDRDYRLGSFTSHAIDTR